MSVTVVVLTSATVLTTVVCVVCVTVNVFVVVGNARHLHAVTNCSHGKIFNKPGAWAQPFGTGGALLVFGAFLFSC